MFANIHHKHPWFVRTLMALLFYSSTACIQAECPPTSVSCNFVAAGLAIGDPSVLGLGGSGGSGSGGSSSGATATGTEAWSVDGVNAFGDDAALDVAVDTSGNVYVVGYGTNLVGGSTGEDWWIKKYDSNGNEIMTGWNKSFDADSNADRAQAVVIDSAGDIIVAGFGTNLVTSGGSSADLWLRKFQADGTEITSGAWPLEFATTTLCPGGSRDDRVEALATDSSGNIYMAGQRGLSTTCNAITDWWIKKFASDGTEITAGWDKTHDAGASSGDSARDIIIDGLGQIYVVGTFRTTTRDDEMGIKKYQSDGTEDTVNWDKTLGQTAGFLDDTGSAIAIDADNNVYTAGQFFSGPVVSRDMVLKKFQGNGTEITTGWDKRMDGGHIDDALGLVYDGFGHVYVVGYGTHMVSGSSNRDWWIKKFATDGTEVTSGWDKRLDVNGGADTAYAITVDSTGAVYVVGGGSNFAGAGTGLDWWVKKFE